METARLRLFVALQVPETLRAELECVQGELRSHLPGNVVRWTRPEQMHLTLRFLGNVSANKLDSLIKAASAVCTGFAPIKLRSERIGFFPHIRSPRVIWAWVHDDWGELVRFQAALADATAGFADHHEKKGFTGHLTLARIRDIKPAQARALGEIATGLANRVFGDWTANSVAIIRSELSAGGSRYSEVADIAFRERTGA